MSAAALVNNTQGYVQTMQVTNRRSQHTFTKRKIKLIPGGGGDDVWLYEHKETQKKKMEATVNASKHMKWGKEGSKYLRTKSFHNERNKKE